MRKSLMLLAACAALPLAACATSPYGSPYGYGYQDPVIGAIGALGTVLGSQGAYGSPYGYNAYGMGGGGFTQAAVNACANYATRYGQVRVNNVRQTSSSKVHVYGTASNGYYARNFDCSFNSRGRVSDFDI